MRIDAIEIPNADAPEVLAALESRWKADAVRLAEPAVYDELPPRERIGACLRAQLRVITRNRRREAAERAVSVLEPEIT